MKIESIKVRRRDNEWMGESVLREYKAILAKNPTAKILTIVPCMLAYFGSQPERFEVVDVDVIIQYND